jgi:hypothetical protein
VFIQSKKISWEVNVWIELNEKYPNLFHWYAADHNESLILNIPQSNIPQLNSQNEELEILKSQGKFPEAYEYFIQKNNENNNKENNDKELMKICHHVNRKEEGRLVTEKILSKVNEVNGSNESRKEALEYIKYYIQPLEVKDRKEFLVDKKHIGENKENYFSSTPCIIAGKDGYYCNIRMVNYRIMENGCYDIKDPKEILRTRNILLKLNSNLEIGKQKQLSNDTSILKPQRFNSNIVGLEDMRIFKKINNVDQEKKVENKENKINSERNNIYFFATSCESMHFFCPKIVYGSFDRKGNLEFIKRLIMPGKENNFEKNWLPFVVNNEIYFIYSYDPLSIYKLNEDTCEIILWKSYKDEHFTDYDCRGSASPISFEVNGKKGYLFTVHQVCHSHPRKYYTRFMWYNSDFTERKHGPLFYFEKIGIEYNLSICKKIDSEDYILSYSINDGCSKCCIVAKDTILQHLKFSQKLI